MPMNATLRKFGIAASFAAALLALAYVIAQLLEWQGLLGSDGGPESSSTRLGIVLLLLPSLLLGLAHVAMLVALHLAAADSRRVFSLFALALAINYAVLTGLVYFVQLTFVAPRLATGDIARIDLLRFVPYESFLFAVDLWGYSLMCLSALVAAFALPPASGERLARVSLLATGCLFPALALQMQFPWLIWFGALWGLTYPLAALALADWFRRAGMAVPPPRD